MRVEEPEWRGEHGLAVLREAGGARAEGRTEAARPPLPSTNPAATPWLLEMETRDTARRRGAGGDGRYCPKGRESTVAGPRLRDRGVSEEAGPPVLPILDEL